MVYSKAYQDLNAPSLKILSYFLLQQWWTNTAKHKDKPNWIMTNKDEIFMPYSVFKKAPFNMGPQTITRAFTSLLAHGFFKIVKQGGLCKGHKTKYGISDKWQSWAAGDVIFTRKPFFKERF